MKFTKMHGAGNDFVLVETAESLDWPRLALAMCDRHYGIGADGLLLLLPTVSADFKMRIFNADGSESDTCGNGLRCLIRYYVENRGVPDSGEISVETMAGVRTARTSGSGGSLKIQTGMGAPVFEEQKIPASIKDRGNIDYIKNMTEYPVTVRGRVMKLDLVSMGNPHAVLFSDDPVGEFPLGLIGPEVERNGIFPVGANFEAAGVINRGLIEARVWERGVGETLACGSGACAVTVAAQLHGYIDSRARIKLPGGVLEVEWDGEGEVYLSGPAETVFTGEWPDDKVPGRTPEDSLRSRSL